MFLIVSLAGCAASSGTTIHTLEGKPVLEVRRVRDETRMGWHRELWLGVEGASMRVGTTEPPVPLDPEKVYTFTVVRVETFAEVAFSLISIAEDGETVYSRPDGPFRIGREEAIRRALRAFREAAPGDDWYREDHLSAVLMDERDVFAWAVSCSDHPLAGGGGTAIVDASSGAILRLHIPAGSR
jgi:hypothetical protein